MEKDLQGWDLSPNSLKCRVSVPLHRVATATPQYEAQVGTGWKVRGGQLFSARGGLSAKISSRRRRQNV